MEVETSMVNEVIAAIETLNNGSLMVSTLATEPVLTLITVVETVGNGKSQITYVKTLNQVPITDTIDLKLHNVR